MDLKGLPYSLKGRARRKPVARFAELTANYDQESGVFIERFIHTPDSRSP